MRSSLSMSSSLRTSAVGDDDCDQHQRDAHRDIDQRQQSAGLPRRLRPGSPSSRRPATPSLRSSVRIRAIVGCRVGGLRLCRPRRSSCNAWPAAASSATCASAWSQSATVVVMKPTPRKRRYQVDHALDVVRMDARRRAAAASRALMSGRGLVELDARVAQRGDGRHFGEKATVGALVPRLRVLLEVAHGVGQRLRSRAFGVGKGAHPRHHLEAGVAQEQHQRDDRDERPDDAHAVPLGSGFGRSGRSRMACGIETLARQSLRDAMPRFGSRTGAERTAQLDEAIAAPSRRHCEPAGNRMPPDSTILA